MNNDDMEYTMKIGDPIKPFKTVLIEGNRKHGNTTITVTTQDEQVTLTSDEFLDFMAKAQFIVEWMIQYGGNQ